MTCRKPLTDDDGEVREWTAEDFARAVPFSGLPAELQAILSDPHRVVIPEALGPESKRPARKRTAA
jgi:hypothetical protein